MDALIILLVGYVILKAYFPVGMTTIKSPNTAKKKEIILLG